LPVVVTSGVAIGSPQADAHADSSANIEAKPIEFRSNERERIESSSGVRRSSREA
jgi:hypothetical protein